VKRILVVVWRYIAPAFLWAGGFIALWARLFPDAGEAVFLGCLGAHTLGACWLLFSLRGRRDLMGARLVIGLPMAAVFVLSLWMMRTDDLAYDGVVVSVLISLVIWGMFWVTSYPRSPTPAVGETPQGEKGSNGMSGGS
jgi:hypothetical protein